MKDQPSVAGGDGCPFRFGDFVKCRRGPGPDFEWIPGFRFIAYVPQLAPFPFIVKGNMNPVSHDCPFRAHMECEIDAEAIEREKALNAQLDEYERQHGHEAREVLPAAPRR